MLKYAMVMIKSHAAIALMVQVLSKAQVGMDVFGYRDVFLLFELWFVVLQVLVVFLRI